MKMKMGCVDLRKHSGFHDWSRDILTGLMKGEMANLMT